MEEALELPVLECEAFPGLTFGLWGSRDAAFLTARETDGEKREVNLLSLSRSTGTINRDGGSVPADFLHLSGRTDGRVPTFEEVRAQGTLPDAQPPGMPSGGRNSPWMSQPGGSHPQLQFRLTFTLDGSPGIEACRRGGSGADRHGIVRVADGYILRLQHQGDGFILDAEGNIANHPRHTTNSWQNFPRLGMSFTVTSMDQQPFLVARHQDNTLFIASITRDGTLRRATGLPNNCGLRLDAQGRIREEELAQERQPTQPIADWSVAFMLDEDGNEISLPIQARKYHPAPGKWKQDILSDGRRRLRRVAGPNTPIGATTIILSPAAAVVPTPAPITTFNDAVPIFSSYISPPPRTRPDSPQDDDEAAE